MITGIDYGWVGLAALVAGIVNAIAGGGTLITFPMMIAIGIPPVVANVTNSVALCPGYVGGTLAQWRDLRGQSSRIIWLVPIGILGGTVGGLLLMVLNPAQPYSARLSRGCALWQSRHHRVNQQECNRSARPFHESIA